MSSRTLRLRWIWMVGFVVFVLPCFQLARAQDQDGLQFAFVPDLRKADQLGRNLGALIQSNLNGVNDAHLQIQVVHLGTRTTFPERGAWLINYLKHATTESGTLPENVDINLQFVDKDAFQKAEGALIDQMAASGERLNGAADALEHKVDELERELVGLETLAGDLDKSLTILIKEFDGQQEQATFATFVRGIRTTIENIQQLLAEVAASDKRPEVWRTLDDAQAKLVRTSTVLEQFKAGIADVDKESSRHTASFAAIENKLTQTSVVLGELKTSLIESRQIAVSVRYRPDPREILQREDPIAKSAPARKSSALGVYLKSMFGLPTGMTWIMYKLSFTQRTASEHAVELALALVQGAALYGVTSYTLHQKMLEHPEAAVHVVAGAFVAAGWKLVTGYIERANNAFFVQGVDYDPIRNFSTNRRFFLVSAYIHSLVIGATVQAAANGGLDGATFLHGAWNSFLGLFGKALPLFLVSKHQIKPQQVNDSGSLKHSKWKTIAFNFVFGVTYQAVKSFHLFGVDAFNLTRVFVWMGFGGIVYEGYNYLRSGPQEMRFVDRVKMNTEVAFNSFHRKIIPSSLLPLRPCRTLLYGPKQIPPPTPSVIAE